MTSPLPAITAFAGTNIALVKYWGKRDPALNLPAAGSLSLTLADLGSETTVRFGADQGDDQGQDAVFLGDAPAPAPFAQRVRGFLDLIRARATLPLPARVHTQNSVPTAAGLASSAAGFAALALAASRAAGLSLTPDELSALARRGSGSAARSIVGGFALMSAGARADGTDAIARPLLEPDAWDVRLVVAITATGAKAIGSSQAMDRTARTSPYYPAWVASVDPDLAEARAAIQDRDLDRLGRVAERSAMRMHASALAADPHILYWNPGTLGAIGAVKALREEKVSAYFTIDAGPHVKVLCRGEDAGVVEAALARTPGVLRTLSLSPGSGARILKETTA
jgi:diphosphomevalonate decarboxylase